MFLTKIPDTFAPDLFFGIVFFTIKRIGNFVHHVENFIGGGFRIFFKIIESFLELFHCGR